MKLPTANDSIVYRAMSIPMTPASSGSLEIAASRAAVLRLHEPVNAIDDRDEDAVRPPDIREGRNAPESHVAVRETPEVFGEVARHDRDAHRREGMKYCPLRRKAGSNKTTLESGREIPPQSIATGKETCICSSHS